MCSSSRIGTRGPLLMEEPWPEPFAIEVWRADLRSFSVRTPFMFFLIIALEESLAAGLNDALELRFLRRRTFVLFIRKRITPRTLRTDFRYYDTLVERQRR